MFSDFKEVRFRVPHGTILGPVLFIIHINNLRIQPTTVLKMTYFIELPFGRISN